MILSVSQRNNHILRMNEMKTGEPRGWFLQTEPDKAGQESRPDSPEKAAQTSMPDKEQGDKHKFKLGFNAMDNSIQRSILVLLTPTEAGAQLS